MRLRPVLPNQMTSWLDSSSIPPTPLDESGRNEQLANRVVSVSIRQCVQIAQPASTPTADSQFFSNREHAIEHADANAAADQYGHRDGRR